MKKYYLFLSVFISFSPLLSKQPSSPLSKIMVKSKSALFDGKKGVDSMFRFQYSGDVRVTFADETVIKSDEVTVFVCGTSVHPAGGIAPRDHRVKKIIFLGNVFVYRKNRKVWADRVELLVPEKLCNLSGNVKIEQLKMFEGEGVSAQESMPIKTACERASIHWDTGEVVMNGTDEKPVETEIKLDGRIRLFGKKKKKNEKN